MSHSIPPSDREFLLKTLKDSEARHARRLHDAFDLLSVRIEQVENVVLVGSKRNARNVALSAGTIVSVVAGVVTWLIEQYSKGVL